MAKISRRARLAYFFDNTMSRGTISMIAWLAFASAIFIILAAFIMILLGIDPHPTSLKSFVEDIWLGAMHAIDTGSLAGDKGWGLRVVMSAVTIGGLLIVSTLIGIISNGLTHKLDGLRKGRSVVLEEGHTLILGWSVKVFTILRELSIAQESEKKPCVVILADHDKVEMEDAIRCHVPNLRKTKVICRSGNPTSLVDLEIANPHHCGPIIVLAPDEGNADSQTLKTVLALVNNPHRRKTPYYIVAEVCEARNLEVLRMVGKDEVELLLGDDLIARLMVQSCRQSGLSLVYTELIDFEGCEMYFTRTPSLVGQTFGASLFAYPECSPIGLRFADGRVALNPPMETMITAHDQLIVIAEDDSAIRLGSDLNPKFEPATPASQADVPAHKPRSLLILGWNQRAHVLLSELDQYMQQNSQLKVVSSYEQPIEIETIKADLVHAKLEYQQGDTTDRRVLKSLAIANYDHILILSYREKLDPHEADAQTLMTLLHLRHLSDDNAQPLSIVSEMLDVRTRELTEATQADDFIVSDRLISMLISQISQSQHLMRVFDHLLTADGSEVYIKPAALYLTPGEPTTFYAIVDAARRREEVAIGWRQMAHQFKASAAYGVKINPPKADSIVLENEDKVIVIAKD